MLADRPYGEIDTPLQVISSIGFVVISAVYLGIAEGAYAHTVASLAGKQASTIVQRQVGLMTHRLRIAGWALEGALATVGDNPAPSMDTVAAVMLAKREIALAAIEVCDLAMEVGGRAAFDHGSPIERAYRDVRAAKFHPARPRAHAGARRPPGPRHAGRPTSGMGAVMRAPPYRRRRGRRPRCGCRRRLCSWLGPVSTSPSWMAADPGSDTCPPMRSRASPSSSSTAGGARRHQRGRHPGREAHHLHLAAGETVFRPRHSLGRLWCFVPAAVSRIVP